MGQNLKEGAIVVLESTVYPGVTEEVVVPILEQESGKKCGNGFFVGYSPERINPNDDEHTLERTTKIVSGMDEKTTDTNWLLSGGLAAGISIYLFTYGSQAPDFLLHQR